MLSAYRLSDTIGSSKHKKIISISHKNNIWFIFGLFSSVSGKEARKWPSIHSFSKPLVLCKIIVASWKMVMKNYIHFWCKEP